MSDVRKSVPAKVIASLLILVSVFSLCWQGMAVLRGIDYVLTDSWQDTCCLLYTSPSPRDCS